MFRLGRDVDYSLYERNSGGSKWLFLMHEHKNKVFVLLIKTQCGYPYHIGQDCYLYYWWNFVHWWLGRLYHHNGHCRHVCWKWVEGRWCLAIGTSNSHVSLTCWRHIWLDPTFNFNPTMTKSAPIRTLISTQGNNITPPNFGGVYWGYIWRYLTNIKWNIRGLKFEYHGFAPP